MKTFAEALRNVTTDEARAILQALDQYVENAHGDFCDDPYEDSLIRPAEAVLERLNAVIAGLAELPPQGLPSASDGANVPAA